MKTLRFLWPAILPVLFLSGCEEDFSVTAPYKDITVVYGLLDLGEDTTYLRINKAFLGEGNALLMAQVEDSSVYRNNMTAVIEEYSAGYVVNTFNLDSITVDSKVEGLFYNPYQLVYFAPMTLDADHEYRLKIDVKGNEVTASTPLVNNFPITRPTAGASSINFLPGMTSAVEWESAKNGKRYDVYMMFRFRELRMGSTDTIVRTEIWAMGTRKSASVNAGVDMMVAYEADAFYQFLMDRVPYDDPAEEATVQSRYSIGVDVVIEVAAEDFNTYLEVNEPSNSIVQDRPDYTNITNGTGLFSSRYRTSRFKKLHATTVSNIQNLPVELRFVY